MVRQWIDLPKWKWMVIVYYDAGPADADEIGDSLKRLGCSGKMLSRALLKLRAGRFNEGLTYTNEDLGSSIVVIGRTDSPAEFWNTLIHEQGHVAQHIAMAYGYDCFGEEIQYVSGELSKKMFSVARLLM